MGIQELIRFKIFIYFDPKHLIDGILFSNKSELTIDTHNFSTAQVNYAELIKQISKGYLLCDSMSITFLK